MSRNNRTSILLMGFFWLSTTVAASSTQVVQFAPPEYEVVDPASVNVATGQLSPSLTDVQIGGERGLAHTLTSYTSNFVNWEGGPLGFTDNYNGVVYRTILFNPNSEPWNTSGAIYTKRVSDGQSTIDFEMLGNGNYRAFGDPRYELEWIPGTGFKFTKPDGTVVLFSHGDDINQSVPSEFKRYHMTEIHRPNGFTTYIASRGGFTNPRYSVKTNTGYQFKFVYEPHNRPIEESKQNFQPDNPDLPSADSYAWLTDLPRYIFAVNNRLKYCPHSNSGCSLSTSSDWPYASHVWPDGMPRAAYIGDSLFSITDASGAITEYHHRAIDIALDSNGDPYPGYLPANTHFRPRLVKIVHPSGKNFEYSYRNRGTSSGGTPQFNLVYFPTQEAALSSSREVGAQIGWGYTTGNPYSPNGQLYHVRNFGGGETKQVNWIIMQTQRNTIAEIDTWRQYIDFEPQLNTTNPYDWRVRIVRDKIGNGIITYEYDTRGNITAEIRNLIATRAAYPATCTTSNRKYCNKPSWVSDGEGNKTYYTYHAASGQVKTITEPPDSDGVSPVTEFEYQQHYAYVKNASGSRVRMDDPIWLLSEEASCVNSSRSGSSCSSNDEVRINYYYEHDNLHLTEQTVYSQQDNETLRTCYSYDKYGNRIGETEPNANLAQCPN